MRKSLLRKILTALALIVLCHGACAQSYPPYKQRDKMGYTGYQYTIFPGTQEWKDLDIKTNRYELLQLPQDTLTSISTKRLLETCLYYPMMIDVYGFDNQTQGFSVVRARFNGFDEFFSRADAAENLILYYEERNPSRITSFDEDYDRGCYSHDFVIFELMISQPEIIFQLESSQIKSLTKSVLLKIERQFSLQEYYSKVFIPITANITGRLLLQAGELSQESRKKQSINKWL